jgi:membrane protease YdiL (CAAX protease family)
MASAKPRDLAVLIVAALLPTLGTWLYLHVFAESEGLTIVYTVSKIVQFVLPIAWVWLVQRQPVRLSPPKRNGLFPGFGFGSAVAAVMVSLYFAVLRHSEYLAGADMAIRGKLSPFGIDGPWQFLALALFYSVIHALLEEYYWRWFVFGQARAFMPWQLAAGLSGIAFATHHAIVLAKFLPGNTPWSVTLFLTFCVGVGGAVWAWIYQRSGTLYGPWLSHLIIDAGIMCIGYDLFTHV